MITYTVDSIPTELATHLKDKRFKNLEDFFQYLNKEFGESYDVNMPIKDFHAELKKLVYNG